MKLTEITKQEFVTGLKDPHMQKVNTKLSTAIKQLGPEWKVVQAPTYDAGINSPQSKMSPDDDDLAVLEIHKVFAADADRGSVEAEVRRATDIIDAIFDAGWDATQSWSRKGQQIRSIRVSL